MFGGGQAATLQGRSSRPIWPSPEKAGESIAAVVWMGTLGAVFGPVLTPRRKELAPLVGLDPSVGPIRVRPQSCPGRRSGHLVASYVPTRWW